MACKKCEAGTTGPGHTCTVAERLMYKVRQVGRCWEWQGSTNGSGYGEMRVARQGKVYAHRLMYEMTWGELAPGMVVAHRCDNPRCVKPSHLFPATQMENVRDMIAKGRARVQPRKTHCIHGHPFTPENTMRGKGGAQACRECSNARRRKPGGRGPYRKTRAG